MSILIAIENKLQHKKCINQFSIKSKRSIKFHKTSKLQSLHEQIAWPTRIGESKFPRPQDRQIRSHDIRTPCTSLQVVYKHVQNVQTVLISPVTYIQHWFSPTILSSVVFFFASLVAQFLSLACRLWIVVFLIARAPTVHTGYGVFVGFGCHFERLQG